MDAARGPQPRPTNSNRAASRPSNRLLWRGFFPAPSLEAPYPHPPAPTLAIPVARRPSPAPHGLDLCRSGIPSPHRPHTLLFASMSCASLRLSSTHFYGRLLSRFDAPALLSPRPAPPSPPTVTSRHPCLHAHISVPRGDITTATAVKWPASLCVVVTRTSAR